MATDTPGAHHDELPCALWPFEEHGCPNLAVVSVVDRVGVGEWGGERHAAQALMVVPGGGRISKVGDWDAARRLLALVWNHPEVGNAT